MTKKILSVMLAVTMVFGLAACGSKKSDTTATTEVADEATEVVEDTTEDEAPLVVGERESSADIEYGPDDTLLIFENIVNYNNASYSVQVREGFEGSTVTSTDDIVMVDYGTGSMETLPYEGEAIYLPLDRFDGYSTFSYGLPSLEGDKGGASYSLFRSYSDNPEEEVQWILDEGGIKFDIDGTTVYAIDETRGTAEDDNTYYTYYQYLGDDLFLEGHITYYGELLAYGEPLSADEIPSLEEAVTFFCYHK